MTPQFKQLPASAWVYIPTFDFIENHFYQWWAKYVGARGIHNYNGTYCELVSGFFCLELARMVGEQIVSPTKRDATVGAAPCSIQIHTPPLLGVADGGHVNVLVGLTRNQTSYELILIEPQNPRFNYMPLRDASSRCDVFDVGL